MTYATATYMQVIFFAILVSIFVFAQPDILFPTCKTIYVLDPLVLTY